MSKEQKLQAMFEALCPPLYRDNDVNRLPADKLGQMMSWKYGPTGLLLQGESGKMKTRCMWHLIRHLITKSICPVIAFDCVGFGHEVSKRFTSMDGAEDWLMELATFQGVVYFDDLGKLKFTDRVESELFGVIERRSANLLPIFATTNDTGDSLEERMTSNRGPAMIRRLREFCTTIRF